MTCEECKANRLPQTIPYVVHESAMARAERKEKRMWVTIWLLIALLVGTNGAWMYYESQFEDVVTTIEADSEGGGTAIANGEGSVTYSGEGESNYSKANP